MRRVALAVMFVGAFVGVAPVAADEPRSPDSSATASASAASSASPASSVASVGAEQLQFAAHEHDLGYRAYLGKQFGDAATHFENAFFAAPNPAELRNAIRARRAGHGLARAATLAAIRQRSFAED